MRTCPRRDWGRGLFPLWLPALGSMSTCGVQFEPWQRFPHRPRATLTVFPQQARTLHSEAQVPALELPCQAPWVTHRRGLGPSSMELFLQVSSAPHAVRMRVWLLWLDNVTSVPSLAFPATQHVSNQLGVSVLCARPLLGLHWDPQGSQLRTKQAGKWQEAQGLEG